MKKATKIGVLCGLLILSVMGSEILADSLPLGERYTDEFSGFSLRPPKGGYRAKVEDSSCLVRWICNKLKTEELLWSLSVHRSKTKKASLDIHQAGKNLEAELKKAGAKIESKTYLTISGKSAVIFSGVLVGRSQISAGGTKKKLPDNCFRQMWIMLSPGNFLVIKWDSVFMPKKFLDETWANIRAEIQLIDPSKIILKKTENAKRSYDFLWKTLTEEKINQILPETPQWFLIRKKNKPIGWMRMEARRVRRNQVAGFEIRTWAMYEIPGSDVRLIRKKMFSDSKLSMELWQARKQIGSGEQARLLIEEGLRQQDIIISTTYENDLKDQQQLKLPENVKDILLPKIIGMLLPKLLDLKLHVAYTFAEYDSTKNNFQMRTFEIIGPEEVNIDGRILQAIKATDQPTANSKLIVLWLDEKGNVLRSLTPGGITVDAAMRMQVLKIYPKAESIIRQINQASKTRSTGKKTKRNW